MACTPQDQAGKLFLSNQFVKCNGQEVPAEETSWLERTGLQGKEGVVALMALPPVMLLCN